MHPCPVCPKSFPSPYKLQRHYLIHTGQKPFICTICGTCFTQSGHLKTHLQKVHHPRLPTDCLQDITVTRNQQANNHKPAAGINADGSYDCNAMPSTVSSSVAYQLEWKRENVSHKTVHSPKNMPRESDASVTRSSVSDVMDPITQEQVDCANEDLSVINAHNGYTCKFSLKSLTSSPHLTSPTHNKPTQLERSRESGQAYSKGHLQSQESSSSGCKMTFNHRCPICLKTFSSPSKLQRHSLIHTGQKPYSCVFCRKAFRQKGHLKSHLTSANTCSLSVRTEREKHQFCKSRQTSGMPLRSSVQQRPASQRTHGNSSVELQCQISLNAVQDLVETEIKSEAAVIPEQSFTTSSQCRRICHKSGGQEQGHFTHKSMKPFQCMISNRSLKLEGNLVRRHEMHRNLKELGTPTTVQSSNNLNISDSEEIRRLPEPNVADPIDLNVIVKPETWSVNCSDYDDSLPQDCEMVTSAEQQRETCKATSEQQRTHQCRACLKCFPSVSKLQRHTLTHTGQRPFGCEICGKRFRQKTHLRVHCRTHLWSKYHRQRSLYINRPPSCRGGFDRRTAADVPVQEMVLHKDFETHAGSDLVSLKHLDQTPCVVIFPSYNRESDKLSPHISKHMEVARTVSTVTVKRTPIPNSMQNPVIVQHKCFCCLKCFPSASKLQRHEMVHTGLKPFPCVLCGKAFRQATHLKSHERTHCERKPSTPVHQQENIRKLKADRQRQPRISVGIPQQNISVNKGSTLSRSDGAEGLRPFRCDICGKTFTQSSHVRTHRLTH
ncbi:zinc finger protein 850-like isoform X2 [Cyclopterus lumpus]|uniref:zinc finger protein 850-like isoform X2 n=1 Tax=Cyclopterus lumpus TaxID=8103 RepID=UPI001486D543|nr:zinc finger protein 850-like isoform X2 [Cyclopterus lumpus]